MKTPASARVGWFVAPAESGSVDQPAAAGSPGVAAPPRLRVASLNIRNGLAVDRNSRWWRRRKATVRALESLDADVIGLQEAHFFQRRWLERRLGGTWVATRSRGRRALLGESCPVVVARPDIRFEGTVVRWFGDGAGPGTRLPGASHPRIATVTSLQAHGVDFQVVNLHLDHRRADNRRRSSEQLVSWLDTDLCVVLGDFNAEPGAPELEVLAGAGFTRVPLAGEEGGHLPRIPGRSPSDRSLLRAGRLGPDRG